MTKSQLDSSLTFIPSEDQRVDLEAQGFTAELASELRQRLLTFEENWNVLGMEAYNKLGGSPPPQARTVGAFLGHSLSHSLCLFANQRKRQ